MAGIDLDGNGSIDMYPDLAESSISAAGKADTELNANVAATSGQIAAIDRQLGQGPLGRAIAGPYNDAMELVVAQIARVHTFAKGIVDAGLTAVDNYVAGDVAAAQALTLPDPLPPATNVPPPGGAPGEEPGTFAPQAHTTTGR